MRRLYFEMPWTCLNTPSILRDDDRAFDVLKNSTKLLILWYVLSQRRIFWDKFNWLNMRSSELVSALEDTISPTSRLLNIEHDLRVLRHQTSDAFGSDLEIYWSWSGCELVAYHMSCCSSYAVSKATRAEKWWTWAGIKCDHRDLQLITSTTT